MHMRGKTICEFSEAGCIPIIYRDTENTLGDRAGWLSNLEYRPTDRPNDRPTDPTDRPTGTVFDYKTVEIQCIVNLPKNGCACIKNFCCGLGGGLSRTKIRSGTRCARHFWPQGARSAASALARSQRNGRLPARAHASIKIGARIQSEFRIQIMHA